MQNLSIFTIIEKLCELVSPWTSFTYLHGYLDIKYILIIMKSNLIVVGIAMSNNKTYMLKWVE
jgi:hypothetical protein